MLASQSVRQVSSKSAYVYIALSLALLALVYLNLLSGLDWQQPMAWQVLWQLRLPALLTALLVGASLALSSAVLQVLLRNPLADPGIIGISSGAGLSAALLMLVFSGIGVTFLWLLPLGCFIGALASTLAIYMVAKRFQASHSAVILSGIAISTLCAAVVAWLHLFADANAMRNLLFWLMGSLHQADWYQLALAGPLIVGLIFYVLCRGGSLNLLYFGNNAATLAGVPVVRFNRQMLLCCALLVACSVALAGSIAFVGLIVPHIMRRLFGFDNRQVLIASALGGALLLSLVLAVNQQFANVSLPVSMLTSTIGAPVFLVMLLQQRRSRHA